MLALAAILASPSGAALERDTGVPAYAITGAEEVGEGTWVQVRFTVETEEEVTAAVAEAIARDLVQLRVERRPLASANVRVFNRGSIGGGAPDAIVVWVDGRYRVRLGAEIAAVIAGAQPSPGQGASSAALRAAAREAALALARRWAEAYRSRDLAAYLACYAPDHRAAPEDGLSGRMRRDFAAEGKRVLEIGEVEPATADGEAVFRVDFALGGATGERRRGTLVLGLRGDAWRILREEGPRK